MCFSPEARFRANCLPASGLVASSPWIGLVTGSNRKKGPSQHRLDEVISLRFPICISQALSNPQRQLYSGSHRLQGGPTLLRSLLFFSNRGVLNASYVTGGYLDSQSVALPRDLRILSVISVIYSGEDLDYCDSIRDVAYRNVSAGCRFDTHLWHKP